MTRKHILTKDKFKKWLESKEDDEIVGYRRGAYTCPLATCLKEITGDRWEVVNSFHNLTTQMVHRPPVWANRFVNRVDDNYRVSISAAKALEILEQI